MQTVQNKYDRLFLLIQPSHVSLSFLMRSYLLNRKGKQTSIPVVTVVIVAALSLVSLSFLLLFLFLEHRFELSPRPQGQARRVTHPPGPPFVRGCRGEAPRRGADGGAHESRGRRRRVSSVGARRRRRQQRRKHPRGDRVLEAVKVVVAGEEPPPLGLAVGPRGPAVVVRGSRGGADQRDGQEEKSGGRSCRCCCCRRRPQQCFRVAASFCLLLLRSLFPSALAALSRRAPDVSFVCV